MGIVFGWKDKRRQRLIFLDEGTEFMTMYSKTVKNKSLFSV